VLSVADYNPTHHLLHHHNAKAAEAERSARPHFPFARAAFTLFSKSCDMACTGPEIFTASINMSRASFTRLTLA